MVKHNFNSNNLSIFCHDEKKVFIGFWRVKRLSSASCTEHWCSERTAGWGSHLAAYLEEHGLEVVKCGRDFCDLKDLSALKRVLLSSGASHVVNCAAVSGLEACLDDPETAHRVNAMAPEMMARICRLEGMRFIHLSTDYVLDGRREGLKTEEGKCRPVNVYGESKLEAEFRVREEMPDALVARVSWVFGNPGRPSFLEMVLRRAMKREPLAAVADKWSMPTWVEDLCVWLRFLAYESGASGVLHLCQSGEPVSWHSYAITVLKCAVKYGLLPSLPPVAEQKARRTGRFQGCSAPAYRHVLRTALFSDEEAREGV